MGQSLDVEEWPLILQLALAAFMISAIPSNMVKFLAIEKVYSWFVVGLVLVAFIEDPYVFTKEVWICISFISYANYWQWPFG